jgi:predicted flap endonuclease-1-like 5' DNA nuclease
MTIIIGLALVALGLAVGFVIAWALGASSAPAALVVGVLLLIAGGVIGFVSEWLIDEAYRKNRELRRQLGERSSVSIAVPMPAPVAAPAAVEGVAVGEQGGDGASETLADFLRQRDVEVRDIRERMAGADAQMDALKAEFEAYQRTHPDDLTVIKGVGPVYQWKLRDAGCNSYKQLAAADPDQLRRMLDIKNWQRVNIEAWISQARDWAQRG